MKKKFTTGGKVYIFLFALLFCTHLLGQTLPKDRVVSEDSLAMYLQPSVQKEIHSNGNISKAQLAAYFREKFSERYFFDWKNTADKFQLYQELYPNKQTSHDERAKDHRSKFQDSTQWKLPFNYLNGEPVNPYALRHLSRQHKMVDVAFTYWYDSNDDSIAYFTKQMQSLNAALESGNYEKIKDGNGVYEAFRSGYRVLNWLQIHNLFLGTKAYSDENQLTTIATLLQHGEHLYQSNLEFVAGNHQTRGMSGLVMIAILLRDFKGTEVWYQHAMKLLEEHIDKEINTDGFQFERSVHYHMSDIGNYYYVYRLAQISHLEIPLLWQENVRKLFTTLTKIAYPDKSAPVLQDDTDIPWAEKNDISGILTLGYLIFEDPEMGYFANPQVEAKQFWFLNQNQLKLLKNIKKEQPNINSTAFKDTGYYIMRDGWGKNGSMLLISAGVDEKKPDHQHGDILGVQAMAHSKVILPNYQVRYSLKDLEFFKNSMTKNVALVDDELLGKHYTSNKGGSGFGKFKKLPKPNVIAWENNRFVDLFIGSHNGFNNIGVSYSRQVINLSNDFWIIKDNFSAPMAHEFKQVWQGHYTTENGPNLLRSTFDNGTGLDILQLQPIDKVEIDGTRGKEWAVLFKENQKSFQFITVLFPFKTYDTRIDEGTKEIELKGWKLNLSKWTPDNADAISLTKKNTSIFFSVKSLEQNNIKIDFEEEVDVLINFEGDLLHLQLLNKNEVNATLIKDGVKRTVKYSTKLSK